MRGLIPRLLVNPAINTNIGFKNKYMTNDIKITTVLGITGCLNFLTKNINTDAKNSAHINGPRVPNEKINRNPNNKVERLNISTFLKTLYITSNTCGSNS